MPRIRFLEKLKKNTSGNRSTSAVPATPPTVNSTNLEPSQPVTASTMTETSNTSFTHVTQAHVPPSIPNITYLPGEPTAQQNTELSTSQRLWNAAYINLENNDDTGKLVNTYVKILTTALKVKRASDTSDSEADDISAELKDPVKRQTYMKHLVEEGRNKFAITSKITEGVENVIGYIEKAKGMIDAAIGNIPQAALPWAGVCVGLQILSNPGKATKSNLEGIAHIISRMEWYCALTEHLLDKKNILVGNESFRSVLEKLEETIITLYEALLRYQIKSVYYYRSRSLAVLRGLANWDDWDGDLKRVTDAETAIESMSVQYHREYEKSSLRQLVDSGQGMEKLLDDIHQDLRDFIAQQKVARMNDQDEECLRDLFVMDPQDDMEIIQNEKKEKLFDDSYKWILDTNEYAAFTNWNIDDPVQPASRLLWIKGPAGTGKTMLMTGIIRQLSGQPAVLSPKVSHFFCQDTSDELHKNATDILKSLVWMLIVQQHHLISYLRTEHRQKGSALFRDDRAFIAVSRAFICMLKDPHLSATCFIVDALDECDKGLAGLLELIRTSLEVTDKVKWLVSSRPEVNVLARLDAKNLDTAGNLMELDAQILEGPVNIYIDHKLSTLKKRTGYDENTLAKVSVLIGQQAKNTFLWVALVFKELDSVEGWDAVETIEKIPSGLSKLYDHMLTRIEHGNAQNQQRCKNVLAATFLAYRPLSLAELTVLADLSTEMTQTVVDKCGSFLTIAGETVSLIHKSAKDYLDANYTSRLRRGGVVQGHKDIYRRSIGAMSKLKKNIYALPDFGIKPKHMKPPDLDPLARIRYSCLFWVDHLCDANDDSLDFKEALADNGAVWKFFNDHFLHWLESLSLLGQLSDSIRSIRKLFTQLQLCISPRLVRFLKDAEKFVLSYGSIIERAPLQIYGSALVFSPTTSQVKIAHWKERLPFIRMVAGIRDHWGTHQQTLEGHRGWVWAVVFSPDGKTVASASHDRTVRLWDATTGTQQQTLGGHSGSVNAVVFSPDGKTVASASDDGTVRLWDATTGTQQQTLEGHSGSVRAVVFSPDGKTVASASDDSTVRLWDATTGTQQQTLEGHSGRVRAVVFSPDGKTVASASDDSTVRLWDATTGTQQQTLEGHRGWVWAVVFSPDGKTVASASDDRTVRLWDATTGTQQQTLEGHRGSVRAVVFSPDGKTVASASDDRTVRLWDATTGTQQQILEGHSGRVWAVVFSPDGKTVASASDDGTVRLWDATTGTQQQTLEGHSGRVWAVVFSPDGKTVASASDDRTVRLWDATTGTQQQTLEGHSGRVRAVVFSPDGKTVASASDDRTVRLWDATTGTQQQTLEGHRGSVNAVVFSPDGKTVASASDDRTVRLWDATTGTQQQTLEGHSGRVRAVVFSPDGKTVASASDDRTVRLWDATTGTQQQILEGHRDWVRAVVFSPDGKTVASASDDRTVRLWDATTGTQQQTLEGHRGWVRAVVFSPDGKTVASASDDRTVRLWDATTGTQQQTLEGHRDWVRAVVFSPDGKTVASASGDRTVRLWDATTGTQQKKLEVGIELNILSFDTTGSYLNTDIGSIYINEPSTLSTTPNQIRSQKPRYIGYGISWDKQWITWNSENLLWLPLESRPTCSAIAQAVSTVALGCSTRVLIFGFVR